MARIESFSYGDSSPYVVGGAAPTATTEICGRFGWEFSGADSEETTTFVAEFYLEGTSLADLNTKSQTLLAALRKKYQKLSIDWGASNVDTYDPAVATATGWDARPSVTKTLDIKSTRFVRGFEFRLTVDRPANYADPNLPGTPAAGGRRTSFVSLVWDTEGRRRVSIEGTWTQIPTKLPRAQTTTAQTNNPTGEIDTYCLARLTKIDPAAVWTILSRSERDNNTQTTLSFSRTYAETLNGRLGSRMRVAFKPSRLRTVVFEGAYARTYAAGVTTSARANYEDPTNGGVATAVAALAALTAYEGGALLLGTGVGNCEMVSEEFPGNEQEDSFSYTLTFRELNFAQSQVATGLNDPEVVNDNITYTLKYNALDDSPLLLGTSVGPNPFQAIPNGDGAGGKPAGTKQGTLDKSVVPPQGTPGTQSKDSGGGVLPQKPVDIFISYEATIAKTVTDLKLKWTRDIKPWLVGQWASELGFGPQVELVEDAFTEGLQENTISCAVHARAYPGDVIGYQLDDSVVDGLGRDFDPALTGTPYEYSVQDIFPTRTKVRTHKIVYKFGGAFDPSQLCTADTVPGYICRSRTLERMGTRYLGAITGDPGIVIPPVVLVFVEFSEELIYVARKVDDSSGSQPNGGASVNGLSSSAVATGPGAVQPANPGGN